MLNLFPTHILLGKAKNADNEPVWYPKTDLSMHMLILGRTGSGKSNFIYWVVSQLLPDIPVWFFDRKEDFRHLLRVTSSDLLVFNFMENFKCNPLCPPPYVKPKTWVELFTELFCKTNNLLDGSNSILLKTLNGIYHDFGVYDGSDKIPCIYDLLEALNQLKLSPRSRSGGSRESLVNRIEAYIATNESLFDCSIGFDLEKLLSKSVVFELTGLLEVQANFWINFLLYWIFEYRIAKKERGNRLLNVVVFDEAKAVFSPFENSNIGFRPINYMISMLREFGVGVIAADQTAELNNSVFANTMLKVLFPLGSGQDIYKAQTALGLTYQQIQYLYQLGLGEAIIRHPKVKEPFILQIPKYPLE